MTHRTEGRGVPLALVLSPHLDDAVLSCGAWLAQRAEHARPTQVLTVMGGVPVNGSEISQLASLIYGENAAGLVPRRLAEDEAALTLLGIHGIRLALPDAIYRKSSDGDFLYTEIPALFAQQSARDGHLAEEIARAVSAAWPVPAMLRVIAPLGLGNHVDHRIVRNAAARLSARGYPVLFYEDFPYVTSRKVNGIRYGPGVVVREPLARRHLERKIAAVACYESQLNVLFGRRDAMVDAIIANDRPPGARDIVQRFWRSSLHTFPEHEVVEP